MYPTSSLVALMASLLLVAVVTQAIPSIPSTTSSPSVLPQSAGVGCASRCCTGRDNKCHSTGLYLNGRGATYGRCFCDEGCLNMGDCCFDYHTHCKAVDCQVSDWGSYSDCSNPCGRGEKTRERVIIIKPQFGGEACPSNLKETTTCMTSCNITEVEQENRLVETVADTVVETAKVMPATFGKFRDMKEYNADMDIRKNLYNRYYRNNTQKYTGYCSRFRVISSRSPCIRSYVFPWANVLKRDTEICVHCQQTAMEHGKGMCAGHGKVGVSTHWNAVTASGCSGWWERLEDNQICDCDESHSFIYI